jgi:L-aspartate oxidase
LLIYHILGRRKQVKPKEILVIGAGIAGCSIALALAKRGIPVTILTSSFDQRTYHASFVKIESLEEKLRDLKETHIGCSKATDLLLGIARKSVDELIEAHLLIDRYGNIDVHRCLQEQLKQIPHVEWASQHSAIELLTLQSHSERKADVYKKATCLGVYAYNYETHRVETILAKETILASGGAASLFPYSTHTSTAKGAGLAMAARAGARLLNMEQILFHPLTLFSKDKPCVPLSIDLLKEGGRLHTAKKVLLEGLPLNDPEQLSIRLYEELAHDHFEHLWLDLTPLDPIAIKEKYPLIDTYCLSYGFNIAKDLIPIIPAAQYTCGGIATDRAGQTTVQRLRAIGEVACTGLNYDFKDEALSVLESLTWAAACAEDIAKQVHKFVYYFPEVYEWSYPISSAIPLIKEDFDLLRRIMWHYVGVVRDYPRLRRGYGLLQKLKTQNDNEEAFSIEKMHLDNALQTALLIAQGALEQVKLQKKNSTIATDKNINLIESLQLDKSREDSPKPVQIDH